MMRFDRFTERAQDAASRAFEVMQRRNDSRATRFHERHLTINWTLRTYNKGVGFRSRGLEAEPV